MLLAAIHADYLMALLDQPFAEAGAEIAQTDDDEFHGAMR
jgi:hypothetical protein